MGISPRLARLRAKVGTELLLLPSATVLPVDSDGRILLAQHAGHGDLWATVGGLIEVDESPADAAVREAREEIGVELRVRLLDVLGGPDFRITYANGDRSAYVTAVYEAQIIDGAPVADGDELTAVGWFTRTELATLPLSRFASAVLRATGYLDA